MILREILASSFGPDAHPALGFEAGWGHAEQALRWSLDDASSLALDIACAPADHVLMLAAAPFAGVPALPDQALEIRIGGETLRAERMGELKIFGCHIPARLVGGPRLRIEFRHPDAASPASHGISGDTRRLAFAYSELCLFSVEAEQPAATPPEITLPSALPPGSGMSDADIMLKFSNLGDNCEFGIAQRFADVEPLGLLRFSDADRGKLVTLLADRFARIDAAGSIEISLRDTLTPYREYITRNRHYDIGTHAHVNEGQMSPRRMFAREVKRLGLLRRMMLDDLHAGRRILVYKENDLPDASHAAALSEALAALGPNTLLVVTRHDATLEPGEVRRRGRYLLEARIDRFSSYDDAAARPSDLWLRICRSAYALWRETE